jgi:nucleotide-binding universal stress UspA family protein
MKTILFPTDFSKCANQASAIAMSLAKKSNAVLHFLHVLQLPIDWVNLPKEKEKNYPELRKKVGAAEANLAQLVEEAATMGVKATHALSFADDFSDFMEQEHDLIAMGSQGAGGLKKFVFGTNAQKVVRLAKSPVLVIPPRVKTVHFKSLVYASGLGEDSHRAFEEVLKWAKSFNIEKIYFLVVSTPWNFYSTTWMREKTKDFLSRHENAGVEVHFYTHKSVEEGIMDFAQWQDCDLAAVAHRGAKGFDHLLNGSITENLVRFGNLAVLSIPVK